MHNNISILSINKFIRLSLKIDGFFIPILKKEVIYNGKKENARPAPSRERVGGNPASPRAV